MFYSAQILTKKGALGAVWIASHLDKRLKRSQIYETSIETSVDSIVNPEAPMALRLSGQLLLGVVRIYLRKLAYLEADAKSAVEGLALRGGGAAAAVDLPDGGTAPEAAITLPGAPRGGDLLPAFGADLGLLGGGGPGAGLGLLSGPTGRGSSLAPPVRSGAGGSLTLGLDLTDAYGSGWAGGDAGGARFDDERFDVGGEPDLDRRFSVELERLRSAAAAQAAPSDTAGAPFVADDYGGAPSYDDGTLGEPGAMGAGVMDAPPDDLFAAAPPPGLLGSPGRSTGGPAAAPPAGITPPSLGLLAPPLPGSAPEPAPGGARAARAARRVRATVDAATELPVAEIRALLRDRAPLIARRGLPPRALVRAGAAGGAAPEAPPRGLDVRAQSEAARESWVYRPASFAALAPELLAAFNRALGVGEDGRRPLLPGEAPRRRRAAGEGASPGDAGAPPPWGAAGDDDDGGGDGFADFGGGDDDHGAEGDDQLVVPDPIQDDGGAFADGSGPASLETLSLPGGGAGPSVRGVLPLRRSDGGGAPELGGLPGATPAASDSDAGGAPPAAPAGGDADGFTARTRAVRDYLQRAFSTPAPGSKRRAGGAPAAPPPVSLLAVTAGKPRLDAARWFFEMLVLKGRGLVDLDQPEPYGDIEVRPRGALAAAVEG